MINETIMVSQSGEVNPAPTEKISRVDHVLYGDVNFTLPKSIV